MSGHYIAFEGIEGAGKSTVTFRVGHLLEAEGIAVRVVREPGGTPTAEQIRTILLDGGDRVDPWTEALLFSAARAQLTHEVVVPALEAGEWVLSDRTVYSSLAYQGAGRDLGVEAVRAINAPGLAAWPELVILLRVPPGLGLGRQRDPDRIGAEGIDFQERVGAAFDDLAAAEPDRFFVVAADQNVDDVVAEVWKAVRDRWQMYSTE